MQFMEIHFAINHENIWDYDLHTLQSVFAQQLFLHCWQADA